METVYVALENFKISLILAKTHLDLSFETKIAEIH